ncbi:Fungalysin metallopeptidase-domain-containing protein [Crucibulum laeve]|uniref:Extracellular metalloproteinase n=1 Tax=Crucibulum laeve TaxID=68775 RepID=A0A5C3LNN9_9AGAR|nr:Fungalysin metallopeptidase-domain-containing protein [Crucibulum laeve]
MAFSFNGLLTSVLLALACASSAAGFAAPSPSPAGLASKHSTHSIRMLKRGITLETFHPETNFKTFGAGVPAPTSFGPSSLEDTATSVVASELGISSENVLYKGGFEADVAKYAFLKQVHDGIPFANAVANVGLKDDKVVSFGSSFVTPDAIPTSTPSIPIASAIPIAEAALDAKHNDHPPTLEWLARADGSVSLVHVIQVQNDADEGIWWEVFVDAHSGEVVGGTDFVAHNAYRVLPIQKETLPEGQELLVDPQDLDSSPLGWHNDGTTNTTTTAGNNVIAFKASQTALTSENAPGLGFNYTYDDTIAPTAGSNIDASRTNAFYIINTVHDFAYKYGFTEAAFNFQVNNFDKGGKGGDRVLMSVQDASGTNNANFATPPDGQSGTCRMFLWTRTTPQRDGAVENDIITHEMTHGITNRMTGGGTGRCLQTTEAGGMGEGWSDAMAEWTEHKSADVPDYVMGQYVINSAAGIRTHPYSTDPAVNPLRYSSIAKLNEVHNIGEVWANMLHNVYAALVAQYGWSATARADPTGPEGNIVFLHLFIDALALQPCNPTFVAARDAWLQADVNRFGGANRCLLWNAFASRGLGLTAKNFVDDPAVPADCVPA